MFLSHANKVIACAEWSIPVLEANGVSKDRIVHCPQGVGGEFVKASAVTKGRGQEAGRRIQRSGNQRLFTVGYVGRVTPVKGVHLLVEAFAKTRHPHARLRIFGCGTTESEAPYQKRLKKLAGADARIAFIAKVPFDKMLDQYREMDLLAIPSIWLETGPLTLFEALAMGVPAWGSARIGQMDLLKKYGRVIEPNTAEVWRIALEEAFAQHRDSTWKKIEQPPRGRSMADVAEEMMRLYALPVKQ
jgi:glycosyltransferase involved in cell wall biosynthesis